MKRTNRRFFNLSPSSSSSPILLQSDFSHSLTLSPLLDEALLHGHRPRSRRNRYGQYSSYGHRPRIRRNRYGRYSSYPAASSVGLPLKIFSIGQFRFLTKTNVKNRNRSSRFSPLSESFAVRALYKRELGIRLEREGRPMVVEDRD